MFGASRPAPTVTYTVADRRIVCKFQIVRNNKAEAEFRSWTNNDPSFLRLRQSDSAQAAVDEYMESGAKRFLLETRLPPYLFSRNWRKGLTSWQLSPKGIEQLQVFGVTR